MRTEQTDEFQLTVAERIWRSRREIIVALSLTLAALALGFVAVHGTETASVLDQQPDKPISQPN